VALTASQDCVGEMRRTIQERRDWLVDGLAQVGWRIRKPAASYYVWAPVPVGMTAADFAAVLLRDAGILVTPGSAYGKNGEGYVRFSLTVLADNVKTYIEEAVERVRKLDLRWD
jgi:LL-diaminopimelate aminotransferase